MRTSWRMHFREPQRNHPRDDLRTFSHWNLWLCPGQCQLLQSFLLWKFLVGRCSSTTTWSYWAGTRAECIFQIVLIYHRDRTWETSVTVLNLSRAIPSNFFVKTKLVFVPYPIWWNGCHFVGNPPISLKFLQIPFWKFMCIMRLALPFMSFVICGAQLFSRFLMCSWLLLIDTAHSFTWTPNLLSMRLQYAPFPVKSAVLLFRVRNGVSVSWLIGLTVHTFYGS